jgi:flagellar biosynthesis/type III secretory pathway chaperone
MDNYLSVLEDSLKKKLQILDELTDYTTQQQELLKVEELDYEAFDRLVDQKDPLIQRIMELDQGFETVYDRIKEQLLGNKEQYAAQIRALQSLIGELTDKSVKLQTMEQRNKSAVEQQFRKSREKIRQGRQNKQAALNYYKNMNNSNYVPPQFLDDKK